MVTDIRIEDYFYDLPEEKIARHPLEKRDECKLLLFRPDGTVSHRIFKELPDLLPPGSILICNDTKVINARLYFSKNTGAHIEIFLLDPVFPADYQLNFQTKGKCVWKCLVGNLKKWKEGELTRVIENLPGEMSVELRARKIRQHDGGAIEVEFSWENPDVTFGSIVETIGVLPIPPYLNRETEARDNEDYQTVYARVKGSVAAPTAGLHFTPDVMADLAAHAVPVEKLTLHVGAGTFKPVKSDTIGAHEMHAETFTVTKHLLKEIISRKRKGYSVVAVGTTTVRTLESLPHLAYKTIKEGSEELILGQWDAYREENESFDTISLLEEFVRWMENKGIESLTASTSIMIAPGFNWRLTDVMVTNFHQPGSTLLLLVSSFLGKDKDKEKWRPIYEEALKSEYRFLSYGDACLLFRSKSNVSGAGYADK